AELLEDSSRVLASLSPSISPASEEVVTQRPLSESSLDQGAMQRTTSAVPRQQTTELSSTASNSVPQENQTPIDHTLESVAPVNEETTERREATAAVQAASSTLETMTSTPSDEKDLSPAVPRENVQTPVAAASPAPTSYNGDSASSATDTDSTSNSPTAATG